MSDRCCKCRICGRPVCIYADETRPRNLCTHCYCEQFNRRAGLQQADDQPSRPGNPDATFDIVPHTPPPSLDSRLATGFFLLGEDWRDNR